eukprot:Protomagalhaensia_sp_Gyna_25__1155@NODE_1568_length_1726_cov_34_653231_g1275_i0_p1_GENE_NODE_1568_length_1726_cov_34_653231_g1275_i0NODE_1568_length_1726_cov_34_653231_g1275_i0_p1_ORF_typecomplete_len154_score6_73_NODE_1568_length_1726_cov_34_653231_g1275_i010551516
MIEEDIAELRTTVNSVVGSDGHLRQRPKNNWKTGLTLSLRTGLKWLNIGPKPLVYFWGNCATAGMGSMIRNVTQHADMERRLLLSYSFSNYYAQLEVELIVGKIPADCGPRREYRNLGPDQLISQDGSRNSSRLPRGDHPATTGGCGRPGKSV